MQVDPPRKTTKYTAYTHRIPQLSVELTHNIQSINTVVQTSNNPPNRHRSTQLHRNIYNDTHTVISSHHRRGVYHTHACVTFDWRAIRYSFEHMLM